MKIASIIGCAIGFLMVTGCTSVPSAPNDRSSSNAAQNILSTMDNERAENVILFVGDGMGYATVTAARIYAGQQQGKAGEEHSLAFEALPYTAISKVYNTNQQIPDSAGTATAMLSGEKTLSGVLGVGDKTIRGDCQSALANPLETIVEQAEDIGYATGIVSTARITHATPAAAYSHSADRNWENNSTIPEQQKCVDIASQLVAFSHGDGIDIILGGGLAQFIDKNKGGLRTDGRDLILQWLSKNKQRGVFVQSNEDLQNAVAGDDSTSKIFGLFSHSHMSFEVDRKDKTPTQPSLTEMTVAAIKHLEKLGKRYFLLVEAGRIDHAHHGGNAARALQETVELSNAVSAALEMVSEQKTLVVVTADHGHTLNIGGYATRGNPILGYVTENDSSGKAQPNPAVDKNNQPYTTLSYANGPGAEVDRNSTLDPEDVDYLQLAALPLGSETHSGTDVPVYATGPGAQQFRGVIEQNLIYHYMIEALGLIK